MGTHGMRNVKRLDYNRLDGRDRVWRRKENDIAKIEIKSGRYKGL